MKMMKDYVINTVSSQDFLHRVYLIMSVSIELYRVLVSTLLIIFIPQNCDGKMCTMKQNLESKEYTYNAGLIFNFITLASFMMLYAFEITRENNLIKYLEVNPRNPHDNESLAIIFDKIPDKYRNKIYRIDYYYQKISYVCLLIFTVNVTLSGIIIYQYSLGNQTTTNFITNVLFMLTKVYDTYYVANTGKSIFYSAYMRDHVQFNDIDPALQVRLSTILCNPTQYELVVDARSFVPVVDEVDDVVNEVVELGNEVVDEVVEVGHEVVEIGHEVVNKQIEEESIEIILNEIVDEVTKIDETCIKV